MPLALSQLSLHEYQRKDSESPAAAFAFTIGDAQHGCLERIGRILDGWAVSIIRIAVSGMIVLLAHELSLFNAILPL